MKKALLRRNNLTFVDIGCPGAFLLRGIFFDSAG
jgi:hypothetical protein